MNTLKASLATLTVETAPAGAIIIDERIPQTGNPIVNRYGPAGGPTPIGVKAGKHRLTAELEGHDKSVWEIDAQPASSQDHIFELKKTVAAAPGGGGSGASFNGAPVDRPTSPLRIASYAALGVGVVGLGAGTFFALGAKSKADEAKDLCGGNLAACKLDVGSPDAKKVTQLNNDSGSSKTLAIVGFAVGGVGVAAGITMLVLSSGSSSSAQSGRPLAPKVMPWIGYNSAGVTGQF